MTSRFRTVDDLRHNTEIPSLIWRLMTIFFSRTPLRHAARCNWYTNRCTVYLMERLIVFINRRRKSSPRYCLNYRRNLKIEHGASEIVGEPSYYDISKIQSIDVSQSKSQVRKDVWFGRSRRFSKWSKRSKSIHQPNDHPANWIVKTLVTKNNRPFENQRNATQSSKIQNVSGN